MLLMAKYKVVLLYMMRLRVLFGEETERAMDYVEDYEFLCRLAKTTSYM